MNSKVYMRNKSSLEAMTETEYISEKELQDFLIQYPELLGGDQFNPEEPRRWLLVQPEFSVSGFSIDILFLDQDGVPTIVEVKRACDTRIRREVVGQMLDYAASGISRFGAGKLRTIAANYHGPASLSSKLKHLINGQEHFETEEEYWETVDNNIKEKRMRLIFAADKIPRRLRRIVELLNEEMKSFSVMALEVKQYSGKKQVIVPRVIVGSDVTRSRKERISTSGIVSRKEFLESCDDNSRLVFEAILDMDLPYKYRKKNFILAVGSQSMRIKLVEGTNHDHGGRPRLWITFERFSKFPQMPKNLVKKHRKRFLDTGLFKTAGTKGSLAWAITEPVEPNVISCITELLDDLSEEVEREADSK